MISRLIIQNYLLMEHLELEWHPELNVITGETGAGKSILMDALGLLSGDRADSRSLRNPEKKCSIEAWFSGTSSTIQPIFEEAGLDFETDNILRREILPGGKSRAFVNDSPVTLEILGRVAGRLFDIHGQQDTFLLANPEKQFRLLDLLAGTIPQLQDYQSVYLSWKEALRKLENARNRNQEMEAELDYKSFLWQELSEANLSEGEQEELEARIEIQSHAGDLQARLLQASEVFEGRQDLLGTLKQMAANLSKVASLSPKLEEVAVRLTSAHLELKDISAEIHDFASGLELNPRQLEADEERLNRIYQLQKKHRLGSVSELLALQEELGFFVNGKEKQEELLESISIECQLLEKEVFHLGEQLQQGREAAKDRIRLEMKQLLSEMAMPKAEFDIQLMEGLAPGPQGLSSLRYLFSANPGMPLSELKQVASGGEFSRLMLAFKYLMASRTEMPSLIFDEIDTGISGEVALRVGKLIQSMGNRHQVLVITHSAQMASRAAAHWKVEKIQHGDSTETRVRLLNREESIREIAGIMSGDAFGKAALEAARELIES